MGKSDAKLHRQTVTSFLAAITTYLSEPPSSLDATDILLDALLLALFSVEGAPVFEDSHTLRLWDDETLCNVVFASGSSNLLVTGEYHCGSFLPHLTKTFKGAFTHYLRSILPRRASDPLLIVESWSHIRDSLLLVMAGQYIGGDDEPLALVISPSFCYALLHILGYADALSG